jgi:hypothetical protein
MCPLPCACRRTRRSSSAHAPGSPRFATLWRSFLTSNPFTQNSLSARGRISRLCSTAAAMWRLSAEKPGSTSGICIPESISRHAWKLTPYFLQGTDSAGASLSLRYQQVVTPFHEPAGTSAGALTPRVYGHTSAPRSPLPYTPEQSSSNSRSLIRSFSAGSLPARVKTLSPTSLLSSSSETTKHLNRAIARKFGRSPSTVSREVRRNAAARGGSLDYRASTAQWHADRASRRPRTSKLVANPSAA